MAQSPSPSPSAVRTPIVSLRGLLAASMVGFGALHLVVADTRGSDWSLEGIFLGAAGILATGLAVVLIFTRSWWPLVGAMVLSTLAVVGIVVTRASGYPFGPFQGVTAPFGTYEIVVLVAGSLCLSASGAALVVGVARLGAPGWRFDTLAPVAVIAAAIPGLAVSSWTDDAAHMAGAAHVHGATSIDSSNQHGFAYRAELTIDERTRLGEQLTAARLAALALPTLERARAAGWQAVGNPVPGGGQMLIDLGVRREDAAFDPSRPVALLFASADDDAPIVAVQYEQWTSSTTPPAGFTGQEIFWHLHTGTCLVDDVRVVYDQPHVGENCELVDGRRTNTFSWMIRAWVVPGWENPNGTFAHDHPGLR